MQKLQHIVDGKKIDGQSQTIFDIYDPSQGKVIKQIKGANIDDVDQAVAAAKKAFLSWSAVPPAKRAAIFYNYRHLLYKHIDELAQLISQEHGKTLIDAKGELMRGIEIVEFCTSINSHLKSEFSLDVSENIDCYNIRQAVGVCAGITPFNFPAMVPMWMFPVAIACGNTFVLKVSEKDPSCGLRVTELLAEAGLPDGVLNTIVGDKEAVDGLLHHPDVQAVSFVGSTAVGEYIYQEGCKHNKRVQALCGAKNHMVVMPDADLKQVCDAALGAAFGSAGERCMAISVLVVVGDDTADQIVAQLAPMIENLKVHQYDHPEAEMGPVITQESKDRILNYIDQGLKAGAELVVDGRHLAEKPGFFVGGCLFDKVTQTMPIYTDEIFGPVLSIVRTQSFDEALELVNSHEYGNGAAIFTRNGKVSRDFTTKSNAGMIGVNVPIPVPVATHSFGGWKRSLFGNNAIHGMEGVRFYTKLKTITSRWPENSQGAQFHFVSGKESV